MYVFIQVVLIINVMSWKQYFCLNAKQTEKNTKRKEVKLEKWETILW